MVEAYSGVIFEPSCCRGSFWKRLIVPFGFNPGDPMDRSLVDRGVLITPQLIGPVCMSIGAHSTTQPWRADPLMLPVKCQPFWIKGLSAGSGMVETYSGAIF